MGFFDEQVKGYTSPPVSTGATKPASAPTKTPTSGGFFGDVVSSPEKKSMASIAPTPMANQTTPMTSRPGDPSGFGGVVGTIGDVLSVGQYTAISALQTLFGLSSDKSFGEKFAAKPSGGEFLKQVGEKVQPKSTAGQLLTGSVPVAPNESFAKTFAKELVPATLGVAMDIFLDPITYLSGIGAIKGGTEAATKAIRPSVEAIATTKMGEAIGSKIVPRFGQPELYKELDRARMIQESLVNERVSKLVDPILKERTAVQQRIAQVIKGGLTTDDHIKALAEPIRMELDRVGAEISKVNPKLLSEATFLENKGEYFPRLFTKYEFPDEPKQVISFFNRSPVGIPADRFVARKNFAVNTLGLDEEIYSKADTIVQQIKQLEDKADALISKSADRERLTQMMDNTRRMPAEGKTGTRVTSIKQLDPVAENNAMDVLEYGLTESQRVERGAPKMGMKPQVAAANKEIGQIAEKLRTLDSQLNGLNASKVRLLSDIEGYYGLPASQKALIKDGILEGKQIKDPKVARIARNVGKFFADNSTVSMQEFFNQSSLQKFTNFYNERVRGSLGEIKEAGYPATKGLSQLYVTEIRSGFFDNVSKELSSPFPVGDMIQLPETKKLGALSGKFVPKAVADALASKFGSTLSPMARAYEKALTLWKTFKTAYNPATIARNDLTNLLVLNPLGGVPFYRLDVYAKAMREMYAQGEIYRAEKNAGLNISSQAAAELMPRATAMYQKNPGLFKQFFGKVGDFHEAVVNFYGTQDKFFKLANIIKGLQEDGLTMQQAVKRANFYLIDYSDIPPVVEWLRKSPFGVPFISFTYGVSKPLAKTLLEHPDKLANYFKVLREIQNMDPYQETREQRLKEYDALPPWIKEGQFSRIPIKDSSGRTLYLDLQYILPFNVLESSSTIIPGLPSFLNPSNPVFTLVADITRNKSAFTAREIWKSTDSPDEARMKAIKYAWQQLAPNNPLIPESWSFEKMQDTGIFPRLEDGHLVFEERPDSLGRERSQMLGILDTVFGIKLTPIDEHFERINRLKGTYYEYQTLQDEIRRVLRSKTLLPEEKSKQIKSLKQKIQTLRSQ